MAKKTDSLVKKAKDRMFNLIKEIEKEMKDNKKTYPDNKLPEHKKRR